MTKKELESKTIVELKGIAGGKISVPARIRKDELIKLLLKYYRKLKKSGSSKSKTSKSKKSVATFTKTPDKASSESSVMPLPDFPNKIVDFSGNVQTTLQISCGAPSLQISMSIAIGKTPTDLKVMYRDQIDAESSAEYTNIVDGSPVPSDYVFTGSERRLEFLKSAGQKGIN